MQAANSTSIEEYEFKKENNYHAQLVIRNISFIYTAYYTCESTYANLEELKEVFYLDDLGFFEETIYVYVEGNFIITIS